jgi:hypothetical protein
MTAKSGPKSHYYYQLVAGTRSQPAGVCSGYFRSADAARGYHARITGYIRRVSVPVGVTVTVFE